MLFDTIQVDYTIDIGTIIQIVTFSGLIIGGYYNIKKEQAEIKQKLDLLFRWYERRIEMLEEEERRKSKNG